MRLAVFEGPLELLLALIERRELDISTVSLVAVTGQFLAHLDAGLDRDVIADYLGIAAKLILIKSQSLLPRPPVDPLQEDASDPLDAAEQLARQLREYRRFKVAADALRARDEAGLRSWPRRVPPAAPRLRPLAPIPLATLAAALAQIARRAQPVDPSVEPPRRIPLAERIDEIRAHLQHARRATLRALLPPEPGVDLIVVSFIALLELYRQGTIEIEQADPFGDIGITWRGDPNTQIR